MLILACLLGAFAIHSSQALPAETLAWATANNIRLSDAVEVSDTMETITATRDIAVGDVLAIVPLNLAFRNTLALDDPALEHLRKQSNAEKIDEKISLTLSLLRASSSQTSLWKPWISSLPSTLNSPVFYSEEDLKPLEKHDAYARFTQFRSALESAWSDLIRPVVNAATKQQHFNFAYSYVFGRRTIIQLTTETNQPVLLPIVNSARHSNTPNAVLRSQLLKDSEVAQIFEPGTAEVVLLATSSIPAGDQVTINFGFTSNFEGFLAQGVVQDIESLDSLTLVVEKPNESLTTALEQVGVTRLVFEITPTSVPITLMQYLRVKSGANVDDAQVKEAISKGQSISMNNDRLALQLLLVTLKSIATQWPGTLEEDRALLTGTELSERGRVAVHLRIRERLVLQGVERLAKELWATWLYVQA
eukprot:c7735_g1_i1.p1 GENE.c7735_g1_i1~~c7735_g1_i1.p1  ORF type:complete len:441 (+),score=100.37 c7735_g1_i1:69-1325(+)